MLAQLRINWAIISTWVSDSTIPMQGKFVLISGSANGTCPQSKLEIAIDFVRCFTREVLRSGGGVVVLGSDERATENEHGVPRIFDWVALREVENYASSTTNPPRRLAKVVMSDDAREKRLTTQNLVTLRDLEQREAVSVYYVPRQEFTGGAYRAEQLHAADAMLAIGGGKGTYSLGSEMTDLGMPVLPLDLQIGSLSQDGEGALALHREMLDIPNRFFPKSHQDVINKLSLVSLNSGINDVDYAARAASDLICGELAAESPITDGNTEGKKNEVMRWFKDRKNLQIVLQWFDRIRDQFS